MQLANQVVHLGVSHRSRVSRVLAVSSLVGSQRVKDDVASSVGMLLQLVFKDVIHAI